jgi:hypothetical protein
MTNALNFCANQTDLGSHAARQGVGFNGFQMVVEFVVDQALVHQGRHPLL